MTMLYDDEYWCFLQDQWLSSKLSVKNYCLTWNMLSGNPNTRTGPLSIQILISKRKVTLWSFRFFLPQQNSGSSVYGGGGYDLFSNSFPYFAKTRNIHKYVVMFSPFQFIQDPSKNLFVTNFVCTIFISPTFDVKKDEKKKTLHRPACDFVEFCCFFIFYYYLFKFLLSL